VQPVQPGGDPAHPDKEEDGHRDGREDHLHG
jgi:hypothetical protein